MTRGHFARGTCLAMMEIRSRERERQKQAFLPFLSVVVEEQEVLSS